MCLKFSKYYFGVSLPSDYMVGNSKGLKNSKIRTDAYGNTFIEWKGYSNIFNNKKELKKMYDYIEFVRKSNFSLVIADTNENESIKEFFLKGRNNLEFYKLMERTNGQGTFVEIGSESNVDFYSTFTPSFEPVNEVSDLISSLTIMSEEFTSLKDFKMLKIMVPYLKSFIKEKTSFKEKDFVLDVVTTNTGWRIRLSLKKQPLFKGGICCLNSIFLSDFNNDRNGYFDFTDVLEHFSKDKDFFSYYNYKSGLVEEIVYSNPEVINTKAEDFFNRCLNKPWQGV